MRALILTLLVATPLWAQYRTEAETVVAETNRFVFHHNFWMNLHHVLAHNGRLLGTKREPNLNALPADARQKWREAAVAYKQNMPEDLLSDEASGIKSTLTNWMDPNNPGEGIPQPLHQALASAAPIYKNFLWRKHKAANKALLDRLLPMVKDAEEFIAPRLEGILTSPWPEKKIPVDLVATGHWAPAYTTLHSDGAGHVTMLSAHPRIKEADYALEILFHETSHLLSFKLDRDLSRALKSKGKKIMPGLGHALLFHTTGRVTAWYLAQSPSGKNNHIPYAVKFRLTQKQLAQQWALLQIHWQPYLDRKTSYDKALNSLAAAAP